MATISTTRSAFIHGKWTAEESARLYGVPDWGKGYVGVNALGHMTVLPTKEASRQVDLHEVVEDAHGPPVVGPVLDVAV